MHGRIELIVGPMFAGKTTELMRRVKREIHARRQCFVVKYARDTRYSQQHVASHDQATLRAKAAVSTLAELGDSWRQHEVIAIDEGQFFPDLLAFCCRAADEGKLVIVSALDGDFQRRPFGQVCELMPHCESVSKLTAVCMMCHERDASFTRRTVASVEQELIGGADLYIAACRACYNNPVPPSPARMVRVRDAIREVEAAVTTTATAAANAARGSAARPSDASSAGAAAGGAGLSPSGAEAATPLPKASGLNAPLSIGKAVPMPPGPSSSSDADDSFEEDAPAAAAAEAPSAKKARADPQTAATH